MAPGEAGRGSRDCWLRSTARDSCAAAPWHLLSSANCTPAPRSRERPAAGGREGSATALTRAREPSVAWQEEPAAPRRRNGKGRDGQSWDARVGRQKDGGTDGGMDGKRECWALSAAAGGAPAGEGRAEPGGSCGRTGPSTAPCP